MKPAYTPWDKATELWGLMKAGQCVLETNAPDDLAKSAFYGIFDVAERLAADLANIAERWQENEAEGEGK